MASPCTGALLIMAKQTDTREALLAGQPQPAVGIPVAPAAQVMARNWQEVMASTPGLLLRERISLMQFLCGACEKRTSYAVGAYPMQDGADVHVHLDDTAFLTSLNTQGLFEIREDSTCLCRYCCHQHRELRLGFFAPRSQVGVDPIDAEMQGGFGGLGWPEGEVPMLTLLRPFKCTINCCCCLFQPQEMNVVDTAANAPLGGTTCDWSCCLSLRPLCCVPVLRYNVRDATDKTEFQVHVPGCFAHDCVNCCAPCCCNPVCVMPITAPGDGTEIGSIQSHWPGCNMRGIGCAGNANNNYAVVWPPQATPEQKARILSAVHLIDLNLFERRGNQK